MFDEGEKQKKVFFFKKIVINVNKYILLTPTESRILPVKGESKDKDPVFLGIHFKWRSVSNCLSKIISRLYT